MLADSETQVMSLWPVSDEGTRDLMIGYYMRLLAGHGRSAAMRAVRLEMLKDPKRRHPYFWAGFIMSGDWANIDGKRPQRRPSPRPAGRDSRLAPRLFVAVRLTRPRPCPMLPPELEPRCSR